MLFCKEFCEFEDGRHVEIFKVHTCHFCLLKICFMDKYQEISLNILIALTYYLQEACRKYLCGVLLFSLFFGDFVLYDVCLLQWLGGGGNSVLIDLYRSFLNYSLYFSDCNIRFVSCFQDWEKQQKTLWRRRSSLKIAQSGMNISIRERRKRRKKWKKEKWKRSYRNRVMIMDRRRKR